MATLSICKTLPAGAVQIVTPEPLSGDGGQALNDNFKHIADSVLVPGGSIGELQYNDGSLLVGAGWKMVGTIGEERLLSPGTTDDGATELQVTGAASFTGNVTASSFTGDVVGTASGSLPLTGGTVTGNLTISGTSGGELSARAIATTDLTVSSTATVELLQCLGSIQWSYGSSGAYLGYMDGQFGFDGDSFSFDCAVSFDPFSFIQAGGTGDMSISASTIYCNATEGMTIGGNFAVYGNLSMQATPIEFDGSSSVVADGSGNVTLTGGQLNITTNGAINLSNPTGSGYVAIQNYGYAGNGSIAFTEAGGIVLSEGGGKLLFDATNSSEIEVQTNTEFTSGGLMRLNGTNVLGNDGSGTGGGNWSLDAGTINVDASSSLAADGSGNVSLNTSTLAISGTTTFSDDVYLNGVVISSSELDVEGSMTVIELGVSMNLSCGGTAMLNAVQASYLEMFGGNIDMNNGSGSGGGTLNMESGSLAFDASSSISADGTGTVAVTSTGLNMSIGPAQIDIDEFADMTLQLSSLQFAGAPYNANILLNGTPITFDDFSSVVSNGSGYLTIDCVSLNGSVGPARISIDEGDMTLQLSTVQFVGGPYTANILLNGTPINFDGFGTLSSDGFGNLTLDCASLLTGGNVQTGNAQIEGNAEVTGNLTCYSQVINSTQVLTDAANVYWDLNSGVVATVALGGNRTLDNPINLANSATYILFVKQDSVGGRTLAFGSRFKWPGGTAPTLTTTANAIDMITFISDGTNLYGVLQPNFH